MRHSPIQFSWSVMLQSISHTARQAFLPLSILFSGLSNLNAQANGIDQELNFVTPETGGKFVEWYGKVGRTYFLQVSDPADHLNKWNWSDIIEEGNNQSISYEVEGTADKAFFRLQYTDQTATDLDNADFDGDGLTNLQKITPVARPASAFARGISGGAPAPNSTQTDPLDPDTDHDGLSDKFERDHNLDPTDDGSRDPNNGPDGDPDGDGISNLAQQAAENPLLNSSDYRLESEVRVAYFAGSITTRPSGEKIASGAFEGNSPGSQRVYLPLQSSSQISKSYFVSQLEALPYLSIDDFTEQERLDLSYPFEVNGFDDQSYSPGRGAHQSDAGSSYFIGAGEPYTHEGDQSPSTIETFVGTSRQTRFRIKAALAIGTPFVATYLKVDFKKLGFQAYPYGFQEEITKIEPYTIQIPEGELVSEWHKFKTDLIAGYSTEVRLMPLDFNRDEEGGIINWQPVEGAMGRALPGQRINLKFETSNLPPMLNVTNYKWTIAGQIFSDYIANNAMGDKVELGSSDFTGQEIHFYWARPGIQTVTLECSINGLPIRVSKKINVVNPGSFINAGIGLVSFHSGSVVELTGIRAGIVFQAKVNSVADKFSGEGKWNFVQLIENKQKAVKTNQTFQFGNNYGEWVLDTTYPYSVGNETGLTNEAGDSPITNLEQWGPIYQRMTTEDHFKMYVMFEPPGINPKWVPLKFVEWNWKWAATKNANIWALDAGASANVGDFHKPIIHCNPTDYGT